MSGELSTDSRFSNANGSNIVERSPDYTDYKIGLSKAFKIANSDGWNAGLYYVGASNGGNNGYWGENGYGGASFNGRSDTKDLADDRLVLSIGRTM